MKQVRSVRFSHVSEALQRKLGAQVAERMLRNVGRYPGAKQLATVQQEAALIRAACLETHDPTLGAQIGIGYRDAPTLSSYIAASSGTLREAVEKAAKFYSLADPTTQFHARSCRWRSAGSCVSGCWFAGQRTISGVSGLWCVGAHSKYHAAGHAAVVRGVQTNIR
jgi:hypothetical protein